jgi:heme exporter protein D
MDGWDVALLVAAGYLAVSALVRLMLRRRDQVLDDFRRQVEQQRHQDAEAPESRRKRTA